MLYRYAADIVAVFHFGFILFVVGGGFLIAKWPKLLWFHIPCAIWGALIEFAGLYCPLTPLENYFRQRAGVKGIAGGFIEEYLLPVIYPEGMTDRVQLILGFGVVLINALIYGYLFFRSHLKSK